MDTHIQFVDNSQEWDRKFKDMGLQVDLLKGIYASGYQTPYDTQCTTIKTISQGKDIIVQSQSGTGKTSSMVIGTLSRIKSTLQQTQAIILVHTNQLAQQAIQIIGELGSQLNLSCISIIDGVCQHKHKVIPHIIVGTPDNILQYISKDLTMLINLSIFAIDEVEELIKLGFSETISNILELLPIAVQIIQFTDAVPNACIKLTQKYTKNVVNVAARHIMLTLDGIQQVYAKFSNEEDKPSLFIELQQAAKFTELIVYCNNEGAVDELYDKIKQEFKVIKILKSMSLSNKHNVLSKFKTLSYYILISDYAIHNEWFPVMINFQFPLKKDEYLMRVGRSSRGRSALCINFITPTEAELMKSVEKYYGTQVTKLPYDLTEFLGYM